MRTVMKERSDFQSSKSTPPSFHLPRLLAALSPYTFVSVFCIPPLENLQHTLLSLSAPDSMSPTVHLNALKTKRCLTQQCVPMPSTGRKVWHALRTVWGEPMNEVNQPGSGKVTPKPVQTQPVLLLLHLTQIY